MRYYSNGKIDPTFGNHGTQIGDLGGNDFGYRAALHGPHHLLVTGESTVEGRTDFATVRMSIDSLPSASDFCEPNDSFEQAYPIEVKEPPGGLSLDSDLDQDYYRWTAPGGGAIRVAVQSRATNADFCITIYDANRRILADGDVAETSVDVGAVYFIHVRSRNRSAYVDYSLILDGPDADGSNESRAMGRP